MAVVALDSTQSLVATSIEIFFVDLLLSADNAVVIALACRSLPQDLIKRAMFFGTAAAIVLRIVLAAIVTVLLTVSGIKLLGAIALALIAVKLMGTETHVEEEDSAARVDPKVRAASRFRAVLGAIGMVIAADFVMSLDNVIALAALARGNIGVLVFGVALSIPMLMFGSSIIHFFIERYPILITLGSAFLGWIAGGIAMDDPLISTWADRQAPALSLVVPFLVAIFVVVQAHIIRLEKARDAAARGERLEDAEEKFAAAAELEASDPAAVKGSR